LKIEEELDSGSLSFLTPKKSDVRTAVEQDPRKDSKTFFVFLKCFFFIFILTIATP
jgi:hypothetical protein